MNQPPLLLASSSPYRKELLARLGLPFNSASPDIDETPAPGESAEQLSLRLATGKARALAEHYPDTIIIGSDQAATLPDGTLLNKPGSHQKAREQLDLSSGNSVRFLTGLAVLDTRTGTLKTRCEPFEVHFRELTAEEIENYLNKEQPYDCAGSFKMEGLGIALFRSMEGRDPNSLIGLPLIALIDLLRELGVNPLLQP
ncbi:Maf family protein [Marinobacter sp. UBA3607]|jgi:MAF protein|uniref:Maf family protein n=1 Tax=Marinobacter sp. UBA3607 TaxID=1946820 RepID=UPI000E855A06|nr:Maf family protein [Marinobacter sp. UBA3607]HBM49943.1 septum formation inhibitor Maf [Marinobacter sp.]|tara:strand:+ start:8575 stop:9171 length:597 start_codon:yes stop_codon:yes gene_type:complete